MWLWVYMSEIARFESTKRSPTEVLQDVLIVSVYREMKVRFGTSIMSYVWLLLEPVTYVLTFWALFALTGRNSIAGVTVPEFILTGALPFMYFRLSITKCIESVRSNKALLSYRHVTPLTCFLARFITETFIALASGVALLCIVYLTMGSLALSMNINLILTLVEFCIFVALISLLCMCLTHIFPVIARIIPPLNRVLFFMSGVFYTSSMLPTKAEVILQYNPMFIWIERIRTHAIIAFDSQMSVTYMPYVMMGAFIFIVSVFKRERNRKLLDATV